MSIVYTFHEFLFTGELVATLEILKKRGNSLTYSPATTPTTLLPDDEIDILSSNVKVFLEKGIKEELVDEIRQIFQERGFHYLIDSPPGRLCFDYCAWCARSLQN